jgi:hypothetical protein
MTRKITAEMFEQATGQQPQNDDLERCNCEHAGEIGHWSCGWNEAANLPYFMKGAAPKHERDSAMKNLSKEEPNDPIL